MKIIFNDYGIEIGKDDEKYFLRYDAGELVNKIEEIEISENEAKLAQINSQNAYDIIIKYQNKKLNFDD